MSIIGKVRLLSAAVVALARGDGQVAIDRFGTIFVRSSPEDAGIVTDIDLTSGFPGAADLDLTLDPDDGTHARVLGPTREIYVISGSGTLVYVDGVTGIGATRTLTSTGPGTGGPICAKTLKATSTFRGVLRGRW